MLSFGQIFRSYMSEVTRLQKVNTELEMELEGQKEKIRQLDEVSETVVGEWVTYTQLH